MSSKKSIGTNAIYNMFRYIVLMLFPLVTFPYITRVLSVESVGIVNYENSIISYFMLFAGLGFSTYAIREGSKLKRDPVKFKEFCSEIFTMNICTTILAYCALFMMTICFDGLAKNATVLFVLSLQIVFTTLGLDWINTINEDFIFITIRTIVCQALSLAALFVLVRKEDDVLGYAIVTVFSTIGANVLNFFYVRRFGQIKISLKVHWKKHWKPVLLIFFSSIASTIYTNMDTTMLGTYAGEFEVGIYSCALKIYRILKQLMIAFVFVFEPRLSSMAVRNHKGMDECFWALSGELFKLVIIIIAPLVCGLSYYREKIIMLLSGAKYAAASTPLFFLLISLVFATIAYVVMHAIMLPLGYERYLGVCSINGAIVDCILNYFLIQFWGGAGAALATLVAEAVVLLSALFFMRKELNNISCRFQGRFFFQILVALSVMMLSLFAVQSKVQFAWLQSEAGTLLQLGVSAFLGGTFYFLMLYILKNESIVKIVANVKQKLIRNQR